MSQIVFFDIEANKTPNDIGAVSGNNREFHDSSKSAFCEFIQSAEYLCGHNIFEHDLKYIKDVVVQSPVRKFVDTLYWSPLLFPSRPYHKIGKQYKIVSEDEQNNPFLDAKLARNLLYDEIAVFNALEVQLKEIYYSLLSGKREFKDFFCFINFVSLADCISNIKSYFSGKICESADIAKHINESPVELAYALALINAQDRYSITPPWILKNYPRVENVIYNLRSNRCIEGCAYCNSHIDPVKSLQRLFNYSSFRKYEGQALQEQAAAAAIDGKSLLAIFPTGGGGSQLHFSCPHLFKERPLEG